MALPTATVYEVKNVLYKLCRVKELKEQLHNVQQQLNHKNMEMEHVYEEHKK